MICLAIPKRMRDPTGLAAAMMQPQGAAMNMRQVPSVARGIGKNGSNR
jgi:hypothetical protein